MSTEVTSTFVEESIGKPGVGGQLLRYNATSIYLFLFPLFVSYIFRHRRHDHLTMYFILEAFASDTLFPTVPVPPIYGSCTECTMEKEVPGSSIHNYYFSKRTTCTSTYQDRMKFDFLSGYCPDFLCNLNSSKIRILNEVVAYLD